MHHAPLFQIDFSIELQEHLHIIFRRLRLLHSLFRGLHRLHDFHRKQNCSNKSSEWLNRATRKIRTGFKYCVIGDRQIKTCYTTSKSMSRDVFSRDVFKVFTKLFSIPTNVAGQSQALSWGSKRHCKPGRFARQIQSAIHERVSEANERVYMVQRSATLILRGLRFRHCVHRKDQPKVRVHGKIEFAKKLRNRALKWPQNFFPSKHRFWRRARTVSFDKHRTHRALKFQNESCSYLLLTNPVHV